LDKYTPSGRIWIHPDEAITMEHTFVENSALRELSHEFDGAFNRKLRPAGYLVQEVLANVDIDDVWKSFP